MSDRRLDGNRVEIPVARRIFDGSFERGGRFYCHGASFQNVPAAERLGLQVVIGGVTHPVVEIDYSTLHIKMAYAEAGEKVPVATCTWSGGSTETSSSLR